MATFPLVPDRIINVTEEFKTKIVTFENGVEQRSPQYNTSKPTFKLVFRFLTTTRLNTLKDFFKARKGSYEAFYFVNHVDGLTYTCRFKADTFKIEYINVNISNVDVEVKVC